MSNYFTQKGKALVTIFSTTMPLVKRAKPKYMRNENGQGIIVIGLLLAFFLVGTIGFFAFEANRLSLAQQQLQSAVDSAALAGAATLAGSDEVDPATAQTDAENTALTAFQQNSILGSKLTAAYLSASSTDRPTTGNGSIFVQYLDPNNNYQAVSIGDPAGKVVQITANYTIQPAFAAFLGLQPTRITTTSSGGVPNLDIVLCFDVSGSMDDQSIVTFVKRQWSSAQNKTVYTVCSTSSGSPAGSLAKGTIFNILGPPMTGTQVNTLYPEHLSLASSGTSYPLTFSAALRGTSDAGTPPGNYPSGSTVGNNQTFTDMVVNIDGNTTFAGTTYNGYSFPDLATLVEASRGNLDTSARFTASKANLSVPSSVTWRTGYKAAYFAAAAQNSHPIYDAQVAAQDFFTIMNTNTNCHMGLVSFSTNAGTSSSYTYNDYNIDSGYSAGGGTGNFPIPQITLSSTSGVTNYTNCMNALPTTVATQATNIGDALNEAINQLTSHSRAGSKQAIVLFTDGEPTQGGPLNSDPFQNARAAASLANTRGIPIYTIGLAQTAAIIPSETAILNDTNSNASSGGVAAIAGHGGKFFLITSVSDMRLTFENIARQLVELVHK